MKDAEEVVVKGISLMVMIWLLVVSPVLIKIED